MRVVHNPVNLKLGGALRAGYAAATKDLVFYTDADLPIDLEELPRAVRLLEYQQADVVAAYRHDRTSEGWLRTVYTFAYNHLIRILFGLKVRDVNFAFKLFRRSVLGRFPLSSNGSFIDAEFLLRARKHGCPIIQIGLDYFPRTRGHVDPRLLRGDRARCSARWPRTGTTSDSDGPLVSRPQTAVLAVILVPRPPSSG